MAKRILRATLPDGRVVTRRTHRGYHFVVAAKGTRHNPDGWEDLSWHGRRDLAITKAQGWGATTTVIPVDNPED